MTEVAPIEVVTGNVDEAGARRVCAELAARAAQARQTARSVQILVVAMVGLVVVLLLGFEGLWMPYQQQQSQATRLSQQQMLRGIEEQNLRDQIKAIEERREKLRQLMADTKQKQISTMAELDFLDAASPSGQAREIANRHERVQQLNAETAILSQRASQYGEDIKELDASRERLDTLLAKRLASGNEPGSPPPTGPKSGKSTDEIFEGIALRIGAVVLVIYLAQVLTSTSRYHYRMADRLFGHGAALDFAIAAKNLSLYEPLARSLTADTIGFGKMPATPQDKIMDLLKAAIEKLPVGKAGA